MSIKLFNIWTSHAINRCKYFFTGILYTLHKLTEILWDMAQLATCERPPEEVRG